MNKVFSVRVIEHWCGFPREDVQHPSLELFTAWLDAAQSNLL